MTLLDGRQDKKRESIRETGTNSEEISREEMVMQVGRLKKGRAPGRDGIQNEAWMYGTEGMRERLRKIMNEIWKGGGFPRQWTEGLIIPIHKKGDRHEVSNYRGITLLNTSYKLYAMILHEKLCRKLDEKDMLPDGQTGFRKERGPIDNVYTLNHIVRRVYLVHRYK